VISAPLNFPSTTFHVPLAAFQFFESSAAEKSSLATGSANTEDAAKTKASAIRVFLINNL
jgi:hypothetical protein